MLNLAENERKILQANNALTTDEDGEEVLSGLTVRESEFVLAVERTANQNIGASESTMYQQLRLRHISSQLGAIDHRSPQRQSDAE